MRRLVRIERGVKMDLITLVVDAYDAARSHGRSRADAFFSALSIYRSRYPDLSADEAGREVVRLLLRAAAATRALDHGLPGRCSAIS